MKKSFLQKISHLVDDLVGMGLDEVEVYNALFVRGVFKWFSARRKLMEFSNFLRKSIDQVHKNRTGASSDKEDLAYWRGYLKALEDCKKSVQWAIRESETIDYFEGDSRARASLKKIVNK